MKILSIDFDYFQNTKQDQLYLFPDGIDNSTLLSEIIWGQHYASNGEEISSIGIMNEEYEALIRLLANQSHNIKTMITNSHKHIYDFVFNNLPNGENIQLVNIDMHHDIINDNSELDCGNWISFMVKEQCKRNAKISFKWLPNPISLEVYDLKEVFEESFGENMPILSSVKDIENDKYDMIFLCRSDIWLPPHLDNYFENLLSVFKKMFKDILVEQAVMKPRTEYKEMAEQVKAIKEHYKNSISSL